MKLSQPLILSVGVSLASAGMTAAQSATEPAKIPKAATPTAPASMQLTEAEQHVMEQLHQANALEIAAGKLALEHGGSAAVKQYGEHLIKDHTVADRELSALAKRNGLTLGNTDTSKLDKLNGLHGKEFDRAFLTMMIKAHGNAIGTVHTAQRQVENKDVRKFLDKTLPTLEKHEQHAQQLNHALS